MVAIVALHKANGQECDDKFKDKMDGCGRRAMILNDPEFLPPKSDAEMTTMCQ